MGSVSCVGADMKWIDPNDKTQKQYLPWVSERVLFSYKGKVYLGKHTGGCFKAMTPPFYMFDTWECKWMYLPEPSEVKP